MNGLEIFIGKENVFEIRKFSGKCLHLPYSLNKLQTIPLLSQRQSSNPEWYVVMWGKLFLCVS